MVYRWQHLVSDEASEDVVELTKVLLNFADVMLRKRGKLSPSGATIGLDRQLTKTSVVADHARTTQLIEDARAIGRGERDQLRGWAFAYEVKLPEQRTAAVLIEVEHVEGAAIEVLLPYKRLRLRRSAKVANKTQTSEGQRRIWGDADQ